MEVLTRYEAPLATTGRRALRDLARRVVAQALRDGAAPPDCEVSVLFVTDRQMRGLNEQYRGVDRATDVLAFPQCRGRGRQAPGNMLGDVVISLDTARRQARRLRHSLRREIAVLLIHGVFHLLGYDHEDPNPMLRPKKREKMRAAERACLSQLEAQLVL